MKLDFTDKWLHMALKTLKWYGWYRNDLEISLIWKKWYISNLLTSFLTCIFRVAQTIQIHFKAIFPSKKKI